MPDTPQQPGDVTIGEVYRTALRIERRLISQEDRVQRLERRQAVDLQRFAVIDRVLLEHGKKITALEQTDRGDAPPRRLGQGLITFTIGGGAGASLLGIWQLLRSLLS